MADNQTRKNDDLFGPDSEDEQEQAADDIADQNGGSGKANEEEEGGVQDQMRDLFGSDDDDDEAPGPSTSIPRVTDDDDRWARRESTPPEELPRGPPIRVPVGLHDVLAAEHLRLAKLSNIISIDTNPFDPSTYKPEGVEYIDERGQKRVRLHDTNAIRWRWAAGSHGELRRESNARLVRWSDGSVTLSVGDEVMDVREFDISNDNSFLFARHPNLIQGQGPLTKKITLRPASLTSGSHKRLAAAVERQHGPSRQQRVRATTTLMDPKKQKEQVEKAEEARIKDLEKLNDRQQKQMRRYTGVPAAASRSRVLNAAYLEEEDEDQDEYDAEDNDFIVRDEDVEGDAGGYEDEEEYETTHRVARRRARDEDEEEEAERRLAAAKTSAPPPMANVGGGGGVLMDSDEDISEEEEEKPAPKKKQRAMVMESDSE